MRQQSNKSINAGVIDNMIKSLKVIISRIMVLCLCLNAIAPAIYTKAYAAGNTYIHISWADSVGIEETISVNGELSDFGDTSGFILESKDNDGDNLQDKDSTNPDTSGDWIRFDNSNIGTNDTIQISVSNKIDYTVTIVDSQSKIVAQWNCDNTTIINIESIENNVVIGVSNDENVVLGTTDSIIEVTFDSEIYLDENVYLEVDTESSVVAKCTEVETNNKAIIQIPNEENVLDVTLSIITKDGSLEIWSGALNKSTLYRVQASNIPACTCDIIITGSDIEIEVGSSSKHTINVGDLGITAEIDGSECDIHDSLDIADRLEYSIKQSTGCKASIVDNTINVSGITGKQANIDIKASIEYSGKKSEKEICVTLNRKLGKPIINEAKYDSKNQEVILSVEPNGHSSAEVYIDGFSVGETLNFDKLEDDFIETSWTGEFQDRKDPISVSNIKIERENPDNVVISWSDGQDTSDIVIIQLVAEDGTTSDPVNLDISSGSDTTKKVYMNTDTLLGESKGESLTVPIQTLLWDSQISITVVDNSGRESGTRVLAVPYNVIYSTIAEDDTATVQEGKVTAIDVKANDTHDEAFPIPELIGVEVLDGMGDSCIANIVDASTTELAGTTTGKVISISSIPGTYGTVRLRYTYSKVREDIPAASAVITANIIQRNQEPVPMDDGTDVTSEINAEEGLEFRIPAELLLANDTDRESPVSDLSIVNVGNCSAGSVEISGDEIVVNPLEGFNGYLTFRYQISDGESYSYIWATVTVYVKKMPKAPVASDSLVYMQLTDKVKSISLNVSNPNGWEYTLEPNISVKLGDTVISPTYAFATAKYAQDPESGLNVPYIELSIRDSSILSEGSMIEIPFTVSNRTGSSSAKIIVEITKGDDPLDLEGYLYVHRRPTALFSPTIFKDGTGTYVTSINIDTSTGERSYDIDHNITDATWSESKVYSWKGLRAWKWGVKTVDGSWDTQEFDAADYNNSAKEAREVGINWITNHTNQVIRNNPQESIMISLMVRDIDGQDNLGVWSEQRVIVISSIPMKPVALFQLDKSTYIVPNKSDLTMVISDLSYDANGDNIIKWEWELTGPDGESILTKEYTGINGYDQAGFSRLIALAIKSKVSEGYSPETPQFKITLRVTDDSPENLESDSYSVTFKVYKENEAPNIDNGDNSDAATIQSSTLYEIDDGLDGAVGDDWGTQTNTVHKGVINFSGLFKISDDQPLNQLRIKWLFEGQNVKKRVDYIDDGKTMVQKSYSNLKYDPFQNPFDNTVTDQGFKPGAYKLTVSVTDNPSGNGYEPDASQTSYWRTYANKAPYHFYVVPKLDMFLHNKVNGWIDQSYRESDGATLGEAGLTLEDIVPTIGDTIELFGQTNQYVESLWGYEDRNNNGQYDTGENKFIFKKGSTDLSGKISWSAEYTIEDIEDAPEGVDLIDMRLNLIGETTWGSETGATSRTKVKTMMLKVLPVKLSDFRVTSITDPDISTTFDGYVKTLQMQSIKFTNGQVVDGVPVGKLAADNNTTGSVMRKGYAFYFKLSSKGLKKNTDEIHIFPKFYGVEVDSSGNIVKIGTQLDGYVPNKEGVYESYLTNPSDEINELYELYYEGDKIHSLNTHAEVIIPTTLRVENGSEQVWSGRYGIPADAKFFPYGSTASSSNEYTGEILVSFEIVAYKNGQPRYNYVERGQWLKERELVPDSLKVVYKAQEANWKASNNFLGSVLVFDGDKSIRDEYISNPVWIE